MEQKESKTFFFNLQHSPQTKDPITSLLSSWDFTKGWVERLLKSSDHCKHERMFAPRREGKGIGMILLLFVFLKWGYDQKSNCKISTFVLTRSVHRVYSESALLISVSKTNSYNLLFLLALQSQRSYWRVSWVLFWLVDCQQNCYLSSSCRIFVTTDAT